jgi:hypothetical protein
MTYPQKLSYPGYVSGRKSSYKDGFNDRVFYEKKIPIYSLPSLLEGHLDSLEHWRVYSDSRLDKDEDDPLGFCIALYPNQPHRLMCPDEYRFRQENKGMFTRFSEDNTHTVTDDVRQPSHRDNVLWLIFKDYFPARATSRRLPASKVSEE